MIIATFLTYVKESGRPGGGGSDGERERG